MRRDQRIDARLALPQIEMDAEAAPFALEAQLARHRRNAATARDSRDGPPAIRRWRVRASSSRAGSALQAAEAAG